MKNNSSSFAALSAEPRTGHAGKRHRWLFLLAAIFLFCLAGTASAQSAPGWGYNTWGVTGTYGGSCPDGQTHTYGGPTAGDVGNQAMVEARLCAPWAVYDDPICTQSAVTAPTSGATARCSYTGTYPDSFQVSIICAPGKKLTPASPSSCVNWNLATVNVTSPANGLPLLAPASVVIEAVVTNADGTVAGVDILNNGSGWTSANYNAATGKWTANPTNVTPGTYMITVVARDTNGNTSSSAPIMVIVLAKASATAPAWGFDTWGGTYAMGGSCPGGQNPTLGDTTIEAAANKIIVYARTCAGFTYNDPQCTHPSLIVPVGGLNSFCTFTGDYPGSWSMGILCPPGKSLTPASPYACVTWPLATINITSPTGGAAFQAPATFTAEVQTKNKNGTVTWVDMSVNGGSPVAAVFDIPSGKWRSTFSNLPVGSYTLTAIAGDYSGHAVTATSVVNVYTNPPPSISVTSPVNNRVFAAGSAIPLQATASSSSGNVTQVEFFNDTTSLGTATLSSGSASSGTWVSNAWTGVAAGTYSITAKATDSSGEVVTSAPVTVIADAGGLISVSVAGQPPGTGSAAPASIPLTAAASSGTSIASVEFFANAMSVGQGFLASGSVSSGSYVTNAWTNVPAGSYSITALATDENGLAMLSSPVVYTVGAASSGAATSMYFVTTDHLGTPRLIEDQLQQAVWKWDQQEPFGDSVPNDHPGSGGAFVFNPRFPGQYFDRETNTSYNYYRNYDPNDGRYKESDPIGLKGGINLYSYVWSNPISNKDPDGRFVANGVAAAAGAVFGATFGFASSLWYQYQKCRDFSHVDWWSVGQSTGLGAVGGAITGATFGAATVGTELVLAGYAGTVSGAAAGGIWTVFEVQENPNYIPPECKCQDQKP